MTDNVHNSKEEQISKWGEDFAWEVIEALGQGVTILGTDGRFEYVNLAYAAMTGRPPEELIGLTPADVTHPADHQTLQKERQQRLQGQSSTYETRLQRPDGTIVHTQVSSVPRRENGQVVGTLTIVTDLTERKQAEEKLRESEHRYQVLSELTTDYAGSFRFEPDGRLTQEWLTDAFTRITGYTPQELEELGGLIAIVHPDDQAKVRQKMAQMLTGASFVDEFRIIHKDGQVRWLRDHIHAETDPQTGRPIRFYTAAQDITARKKAEAALRQSEERYRSLADSSGVGIWHIDPDGFTLYINPAMCALLGLEHPDDLADKTYHEFFTPESLATMRQHHAQRSEGASSSYEVEIVRPDSQRRHVIVYGAPVLTADGQLHSLIGTFVDITERKQTLDNLITEKTFTESAIDSLPGIFYLFNTEGQFLRWNKNFETVSGYSAAEMAQLHPLDLFVGPDKALVEERIGAVFETGAATAEAALVTKDGRHIPYFFTGRRMLFRQTPCLVGMGIDITDRRKAEQELQQWAARLQLTLDNLTIVAYEIDADGTFLLSRGKGLDKLGLQPDEVVGLSIFDVYADYPTILEAVEQALAGEVQHFEVAVADVIWEANFTPLTNEAGQVERLFGTAVDVTDWRQTTRELETQQQFIRKIFDTNPNVLYVFDLDEQRTIFQNRHVAEVIGYSPAEIQEMGDDLLPQLAHPDDLPRIMNQFARLQTADNGDTFDLEYRLRHKDGSWRWFHGRDTVFKRTADGRVQQIIGTAIDITDRKEAETALHHSEARYRSVVEDMPGLLCRFQPGGTLEFVNEAYARAFGQRPEELIGQSFLSFIPAENRETVWTAIENLTPESPVVTIEHPTIIAGGERRWQRWINRLLTDENGEPIAYQAFGLDITEQKQIAAERDAIFERNQALVQALGEIVYEWRPLQDEIEWSGDYGRILGYSPAEMGHDTDSWTGRVHPDDLERALQEVHNASAEGRTYNLEYRFLHHNGRYIWMHDHGVLFHNAQGEVEKVIGVLRDINQRKEAEEALRKSEARYRRLFENALVGVFRSTPGGRFLQANPALVQMLGYDSEEELLTLNLPEDLYVDTTRRSRIQAEYEPQNALRGLETTWKRKDGQHIIVKIDGRVVRDKQDNILYYEGVIQDITKRKRTAEALKRSESNLKAILNNTLQSFILLDRQGRIQAFNKVAKERATLILEQGIEAGNTFVETVSPSMEVNDFQSNFEKALQGQMITTEDKVTALDGATLWFESNYTPVIEEDGEITGVLLTNLNITDRKQAEQELVEEKAFTDAIIDSLPGAFFVFDEAGHFLRWNRNMEDVIGYSEQEILTLHPLDMIPEAEKALVAAKIQEVFAQGEAELEADLLSKDGRTIPYLFTGRRILLKGKPALIGLGIDISDRQQAEEKLRQSEANLQAIFNNTLQAFLLFDTDRRVQAANRVANDWAKQVLGRPLAAGELADALFGQFNFENFRQVFSRTLQGETIIQQRPIRVGNQTFWFETNHNPVITETGAVVGVSLSILNITAHKEAEEALQQSKTQLQHVIDTVPEGVLLLDAQGHIYLTNPLAEQYLQILAPDLESALLTHLGQRPLENLLTSPPKGLWHDIPFDEYIFEAIARPIENSTDNSGWVLVLRDVTQEREIQQRIQRQERLAAVGQLAAGIAHDFNNILAVITLYTQLLSRTVHMPNHAQEKLKTIKTQSERASDLIQQILDFSRQAVLERQPLDLFPFMKELVKLLNRTLPENIQISLNHAHEEYIIQADPSRIQQVMMNLAVNARDAMPGGGQLQINLAHVQTETAVSLSVRDLPPGRWVQIQVTDSGSGIPAEVLSHIFEPFFTTKEVGKGTGLGLAQVYGIVQQHDGYIDISTEMGQGTTFTLYFPTAFTGENLADTVDRESLQLGQGQTILIVEDDVITRAALVDSLTMLNYQIMEADNGREALTLLDAHADELDLLLSDVVMPEMGGIALLRTIRKRNIDIPVVLLTGHPLMHELEDLQTLGLAGWLSKPPNLETLSQLLAQALAR